MAYASKIFVECCSYLIRFVKQHCVDDDFLCCRKLTATITYYICFQISSIFACAFLYLFEKYNFSAIINIFIDLFYNELFRWFATSIVALIWVSIFHCLIVCILEMQFQVNNLQNILIMVAEWFKHTNRFNVIIFHSEQFRWYQRYWLEIKPH